MTKEEYNEEPMLVCKHCLWPGNMEETSIGEYDIEICPCCGSIESKEVTVEQFDKEFRSLYKQGSYLNLKHGNLKGVELFKYAMSADPQTF